MSGKLTVSALTACFLATSWKFDHIAASPTTRVDTPARSETSARRSSAAKSKILSCSTARKGTSAARPPSKRWTGPPESSLG